MSTHSETTLRLSESDSFSSSKTLIPEKSTEMNDPTLNFTATGRPMRVDKPSGLSNMPGGIGFTPQAPQLLPVKFSDDDIILVPVWVQGAKAESSDIMDVEEKETIMHKLKATFSPSINHKDGTLKMVQMPRREYLKYFAKDEDGKYLGTDPQREWTDEEIEDSFGRYRKVLPREKAWTLDKMLSGLGSAVAF